MSLDAPAADAAPITVTLPDGARYRCPTPVTPADIARRIGPGLARQAVAARVDGRLVDLGDPIGHDARVEIVTARDPDGLRVIRASCAQLLGNAIEQCHPSARVAGGAVTEHGFTCDVAVEPPLRGEDLRAIEARLAELVALEYDIVKARMARDEARHLFSERGETYALRRLEERPEDDEVTLYFHEGDYVDPGDGPVVPNTRFLEHVRLTSLAGAYWRGDADGEQLQRLHGIAWAGRAELEAHLARLEEAERRDHRRLGRELGLFHLREQAPGAVFWQPRGWVVFRSLVEFLRRRQQEAGYVEVNTPDAMDRGLWETSGHWQNYRHHMFTAHTEGGEALALKPMNCPGSVLLYGHGRKSYRDLPIRMGEFGKVHRHEPSGALHGLLRVRHFTQDDAHIYCTPAQMLAECRRVVTLVLDVYRQLGFDDVAIRLSTRPANRMGDEATWDRLEGALARALDDLELGYRRQEGEGAFYGPKLEFVLRDALGRDWQCGTLQVDMSLPERFGIDYVDEDGERRRPVMLHRALLGSLERFIGILLEHHGGSLPAWLAPVQAAVLSVNAASADYAREVAEALQGAGLRAEADARDETLGYRIREHRLQRVPYLLVVGDREREAGRVSVRARDAGDLGVHDIAQAMVLLHEAAQAPDVAARRARQERLMRRLAAIEPAEVLGVFE